MTIRNNGYDKFSTNSFYFNAVADKVKYDYDYHTFTLNDWDSVDVLDGGTFKGTLVFQIPKSATEITLGYEYPFSYYKIVWTGT